MFFKAFSISFELWIYLQTGVLVIFCYFIFLMFPHMCHIFLLYELSLSCVIYVDQTIFLWLPSEKDIGSDVEIVGQVQFLMD